MPSVSPGFLYPLLQVVVRSTCDVSLSPKVWLAVTLTLALPTPHVPEADAVTSVLFWKLLVLDVDEPTVVVLWYCILDDLPGGA